MRSEDKMKKVLSIIFFISCLWTDAAMAKSSPLAKVENTITAAATKAQTVAEQAMTFAETTMANVTKYVEDAKSAAADIKGSVDSVKSAAADIKGSVDSVKGAVTDTVNNAKNMQQTVETGINNVATGNFKPLNNNDASEKVYNVAVEGVGGTIDSNEPTADMQDKMEKYVNNEDKNDVEAQAAFSETQAEELRLNTSASYARALVKRYKLQKEGENLLAEMSEKSDDGNIPQVMDKIIDVRMRGDARWIGIMQNFANRQELETNFRLVNLRSPTKPEEDTSANQNGEAQP